MAFAHWSICLLIQHARAVGKHRLGGSFLNDHVEIYIMKSHSILLVSRRAYFREELRDLLLASGHSVRTVEDGLEALEVIRHQDLDLIVTDLDLPRMDGIELVANARDLRRRVRIVMFSTACPRERERMLRKMGVQWVGHPKTPQQAVQGIGHVLNTSSQGGSVEPIAMHSRANGDAER